MQNALENMVYIKEEKYENLNGCPSSYGLDDYLGLCYEEGAEGYEAYDAQLEQCKRCWKRALGVK